MKVLSNVFLEVEWRKHDDSSGAEENVTCVKHAPEWRSLRSTVAVPFVQGLCCATYCIVSSKVVMTSHLP